MRLMVTFIALGKTQNTLGNMFNIVNVQTFMYPEDLVLDSSGNKIIEQPRTEKLYLIAHPSLALHLFKGRLYRDSPWKVLISPRLFSAFTGFLPILPFLFSSLFTFCNHCYYRCSLWIQSSENEGERTRVSSLLLQFKL